MLKVLSTSLIFLLRTERNFMRWSFRRKIWTMSMIECRWPDSILKVVEE